MAKEFTKEFALKAILAIAIVLSIVMTYSIYMKAKPAGFSMLYFGQESVQTGNYVVVLENAEGKLTEYQLAFLFGNKTFSQINVSIQDGQKKEFPIIEHAPGCFSSTGIVEVKAFRAGKPALDIYAMCNNTKLNG